MVLAVALAPSCRKAEMTHPAKDPVPAPPAPPAPAPAMLPAPDAATATATPALGDGLSQIAFAPGTYRLAVQRTQRGTHARNVVRVDATAAFVLELRADGAAIAQRGWSYRDANDGPSVHTAQRYREQQGYRGTYEVQGGTALVTLQTDDGVCPHEWEGTTQLPRTARVALRCVLAQPHGHAVLGDGAPALLCAPEPPLQTDELTVYAVDGIGPRGWLALGSGNGLRVRVTGRPPFAQAGDPSKVVTESAAMPLALDIWKTEF